MALDTRWKEPQGKTPEQLYDAISQIVRELRKGAFLSGVENPDADGVPYDNTASGLAADNVQDAIDEVEGRVDDLEASSRGEIVAIVEDQKTSGTDGQTLTTATDNVRVLNTLVYNRNTLVSIASNRFTLPAGTWEVEWEAPARTTNASLTTQTFLYNQTDAAEVKRGTSFEYVDTANNTADENLVSRGSTVVTIAASKAFEIRHRVVSAGTILGGAAASFGTEVYTRVIVRRA